MTPLTDRRPRPGVVLPWAAVDMENLCSADLHQKNCKEKPCYRGLWMVVMDGDEPLMMACPKCDAEQEDCDGLGVLYCPVCGYCTHASVDGDVCGLCGKQVGR